MIIEEHIKLIKELHYCHDIDEFNDFANLHDINLYQGVENYKSNTTEVIIDNKHYMVIGLFTGGKLEIVKVW